ncbi:Glyco_trans_2-like domain-containing protein [Azospirillaceae bacterium]
MKEKQEIITTLCDREASSYAPWLSIVTVVRNDLPKLIATFQSLIVQDHQNFEWIVVDGASTDGVQAWLTACGDRVAWWRSAPDSGIYEAMNIGLSVVRGDYVLFLNAGDKLPTPQTLGRIAAECQRLLLVPDFIYGDALEESEDGRRLYKPARSYRTAWYGMFAHHQSIIYSRMLAQRFRFDVSFSIGADYALTLQTLQVAQGVVKLPIPFCIFATGGVSWRRASQGRRDQMRIRRKVGGYSRVLCLVVFLIQWGSMTARRVCPIFFEQFRCSSRQLYQFLKQSRSNDAGDASDP